MDAVPADTVYSRPKYSGGSHAVLTLLPPAVGYLASVLLVFIGPFTWWGNWLIVGAVWGATKPIRTVVRSAFKYITYEFRSPEFSWWKCVKDEFRTEVWSWRREPGKYLSVVAGLAALEAVFWPVLIPIGALFWSNIDHG